MMKKAWKKLLSPNSFFVFLLSLLCTEGLVWVFSTGRELTIPAYPLYDLSAYALTVLCLLFWKRLPWLKYHFQRDPLAQALYNLFVLQVGLLWVFGGENYPWQKLMNNITGTAVCLLVLGMGIHMIRRANQNLKNEHRTA